MSQGHMTEGRLHRYLLPFLVLLSLLNRGRIHRLKGVAHLSSGTCLRFGISTHLSLGA